MSDLIKQRLSEYFKKEQSNAKDTFNQLSLFIFGIEDAKSDLYQLAKLLPEEYLFKIINYYDGSILKVPSKEKYKEALLLSLIFYFYEIKKLSWNEIREILKLDRFFTEYSPISLGKKIVKIKKIMNKQLYEILNTIDLNTVIEEIVKAY